MERNDPAQYQHFTIQIPSTNSAAASSSSSSSSSRAQQAEREREIEPMFDKALTPSDVGKLNRLVIPKQQAERHFPVLGHGSAERGTELLFTDLRTGKQWQFRYCYWGSSQSYVMTKGWSRFVRENNLNPGDTVLFLRDGRNGKFLIDYHHNMRPVPPQLHPLMAPFELRAQPNVGNVPHVFLDFSAPRLVVRETRRVRLFGVNIDSDIEDPDASRGRDNNQEEWGSRSI